MHNLFEDRTRTHTTVFSDTAIFAVRAAGDEPTLKDVIKAVGMRVCDFITIASAPRLPLIYRGFISLGELEIDEEQEILVGQSLNDAAEWHERADAAIIWMTPQALRLSELADDESPLFFRWAVPLKDCGQLETFVLNPFWSQIRAHGFDDVDTLAERYLAPFNSSDQVDVVRKRQNMAKFLAAARAYSERAGKKHAHSLWRPEWEEDTSSDTEIAGGNGDA